MFTSVSYTHLHEHYEHSETDIGTSDRSSGDVFDKSIPPVRIIKHIPTATIASTDVCLTMFIMFVKMCIRDRCKHLVSRLRQFRNVNRNDGSTDRV